MNEEQKEYSIEDLRKSVAKTRESLFIYEFTLRKSLKWMKDEICKQKAELAKETEHFSALY